MNSESGQKCIMSEKTCIKLSDRLVFCFMFFCPPPPFSLFLSRYFSTLSFIILSILLFFLSHSLFFVSFSLSLLSLYLVFTSPFYIPLLLSISISRSFVLAKKNIGNSAKLDSYRNQSQACGSGFRLSGSNRNKLDPDPTAKTKKNLYRI